MRHHAQTQLSFTVQPWQKIDCAILTYERSHVLFHVERVTPYAKAQSLSFVSHANQELGTRGSTLRLKCQIL